MTAGAGGYSLHTLVVEIFHAPRCWRKRSRDEGLADRVFALRVDHTLGGTGVVCWPVTYQAGRSTTTNITHYGMRFRVTVKVNE